MKLVNAGRVPAVIVLLSCGVGLSYVTFRHGAKAALLGALLLNGAPSGSAQQKTVIMIDGTVKQTAVKRLGVNLGMQTFYDSRQIRRNLIGRNPGFEGQMWQSILQCKRVTANSCTDWNASTGWPEQFLQGGSYEFILGSAQGRTGTITTSTSKGPTGNSEITVELSAGQQVPAVNDYLVVRKETPGNGAAGWASSTSAGATITTESSDLSPRTPGKQALRLDAALPGQSATLKQYFDSIPSHSYVQLKGKYAITFRAKALGGSRHLNVSLRRLLTGGGSGALCSQDVLLGSEWKDYEFKFIANELGNSSGTVELNLNASGSSLLLDDVSVAQERTPDNPTVFRDEVVKTLRRLNPGVLRYMDSGTNFGSNFDNMIAPEFARMRTGNSKRIAEAPEIPTGLHDFLELCKLIGAEPWYTVQIGTSKRDVQELIEYLAGDASTVYGRRRASLGQTEAWTSVFPVIHLEYGNEAWNSVAQGAEMHEASAYGRRAAEIFKVVRSSPGYSPAKFDLIMNGFAVNTYWTKRAMDASDLFDTVDFAPYLYSPFTDDSSNEAIFAPMLAEPEMRDSTPRGNMQVDALLVRNARRSAQVAVYETNIGTTEGTVSQASIDKSIPSIAAGLASVEHMLLMLRDLGVRVQNTFTLGQQGYAFTNTKTHEKETSPVWGIVLDMGGATNRVRPAFLAQELANQAILPTMLNTTILGSNPVWLQHASPNGKVELPAAHILQSFAFTDASSDSVIVFNLSRTENETVYFAGAHAPRGPVTVRTLTAAHITDSNEVDEKVKILERTEAAGEVGSRPFVLPPFSMTTITSHTAALHADSPSPKTRRALP